MTDTATQAELRSQMYKHNDFVNWATSEGFLKPSMSQAETIAVFAAKRNAYRATERYATLREAGDPTKAARDAERAKAREAKAKERAEAQEAKATKATKATAPAKATKATKKAAATAEDPFA